MAKAYRAKQDVSFPRVISRVGEGDSLNEASEGTNYPAGAVVEHATLPQFLKERAEGGELDHLLEPLSDEEAENAQGYSGEPEFGIFVAEHEAEATALEAAGHRVVPKEQVLEALSAGEDHAANYQRAVREAGLDHRPAQEFMAQERPRVPDEVLYGAQTPAGAPYDTSPDRAEDRGEENDGEEQDAPRARPPTGGPEAERAGGQASEDSTPPGQSGVNEHSSDPSALGQGS